MEEKIELNYLQKQFISKKIKNSIEKHHMVQYMMITTIYLMFFGFIFIFILPSALSDNIPFISFFNVGIIKKINDFFSKNYVFIKTFVAVGILLVLTIIYRRYIHRKIFEHSLDNKTFFNISTASTFTLVNNDSIKVVKDNDSRKRYIEYDLRGKRYKSCNLVGNTIDELLRCKNRLLVIEFLDTRYEIALTLTDSTLVSKYL